MTTIKSENWDGVSAPAIPSGWTVDTELVTATTSSPTSAPNSLVYPAASANTANAPFATWATADGNGGNVQVSATLRFASTSGSGEQFCAVFARSPSVAQNATQATNSYYLCGIDRGPSGAGLIMQKRVSGTNSTLGAVGASAFADATNYRVFLSCVGSTLHGRCQRLSDSAWLNSAGTFVSDPTASTVALSVTDTSLAAASGYAGLSYYLETTGGGNVSADDWLLETYSAAAIRAAPAHLLAGSGNQTVTLVGQNTSFSTSSSTQFTLSGGVGASIVSQSAASASAATLVINPGTASGTLVITDTTDGSITTSIAVSSTYYVAPAGSDANSGQDSAHPWQTIAHVNAQTLYPGDQVLFQGGQTFAGNLVIGNSGSITAPITISSYGAGTATINPGTGTGIAVNDADYVHLSNLSVLGPGCSATGNTSTTTSTGLGVDVHSSQTQASIASWRTGLWMDNITVQGTYDGIHVRTSNGIATPGPYPVGFADVRITNCTVQQCLGTGIMVQATNATATIYSCIENGGVSNLTPYNKNVYVGDCSVQNIYGDSSYTAFFSGNGISLCNVETGTVDRCFVHNCGQANGHTTGGGPGGILLYACTGISVQFCEASHQHDPRTADGVGMDIDGSCRNCVIQYCYTHDCDGTGLMIFDGGGSGPTDSNTLRYSISQNDGRLHFSAGFRIDGGCTNSVIHNCLFYSDAPGVGPGLIEAAGGTNAFYNNIFWAGPGVLLFDTNWGGVSGARFCGNLYWFGGGAFSLVYGGVTYTSLAAFQAVQENAAGFVSGVVGDPLFAAAGGGGTLGPSARPGALRAYELAAGSPARDAGLDLRTLFGVDPGLLDFHAQTNRAGSGFDIGACEYGASALLGASGGSGLRRVSLGGGIGG